MINLDCLVRFLLLRELQVLEYLAHIKLRLLKHYHFFQVLALVNELSPLNSALSFLFKQSILLNEPCLALDSVVYGGHVGSNALDYTFNLSDDLLSSPLVLVDSFTELTLLADHVVHSLLQLPVEP